MDINVRVNHHYKDGRGGANYFNATAITVSPIMDKDMVYINTLHGFVVMSTSDARRFAAGLAEVCRAQREKFKPLGWKLTHFAGETKEVPTGCVVQIIGDSFIIMDGAGAPACDALPSDEWTLEPLIAAPAE